jgi:hypothetical protein
MKVGLKLMTAVSVGAGALAIAATAATPATPAAAATAEPSAAQLVMVATGGWCPWHHHWCPGPIEG